MHLPAEPYGQTASTGHMGQLRPVIFVVEDEAEMARLVSYTLQAAGFDVRNFGSAAAVLTEATREMPALFVLDVRLPGTDGFELCRQIREIPVLSATPVIFLTVKDSEADRVKGLELGGDDYITKPFSPRELAARVRGMLRGAELTQATTEAMRLGDLEINFASMTLHVQGRIVGTTVREFRVLEYLASHLGRVVTRAQLLNALWNETPFVTRRSVDVYVLRLRQKIEPDPHHPQYLKTLRGSGYRLEAPEEVFEPLRGKARKNSNRSAA